MNENFGEVMLAHGIRRIERHFPSDLLPFQWFAVELDDSRMIGTGRTLGDAYAKADFIRQDLMRKDAA